MIAGIILQTGQTDTVSVAIVLGTIVVVVGVSLVYNMAFIRGLGSGSGSPESKTNCSACGARVQADRERCDYCGEPIPEEA